jgi:glutamine cyclotransferase
MSTGAADGKLHFLDPETLESKGSLVVTDGGKPVAKLNELEHVDGFVYANVYTSDDIVKIDLKTGEVVVRYNLKGLLPEDARAKLKPDEVLNGIAYDSARKVFLVTGKNWPFLFEIQFKEP